MSLNAYEHGGVPARNRNLNAKARRCVLACRRWCALCMPVGTWANVALTLHMVVRVIVWVSPTGCLPPTLRHTRTHMLIIARVFMPNVLYTRTRILLHLVLNLSGERTPGAITRFADCIASISAYKHIHIYSHTHFTYSRFYARHKAKRMRSHTCTQESERCANASSIQE